MIKKEVPEGFEEVLKALCDSYDERYGIYCESPYEGKAILEYYYQIREEEI